MGANTVRPGALTQLLADLARAPEGAGWEVPLSPGDAVGRFEIQREIGRGGFGVVYEARDSELGRSVAFKAIRASGADAAREALALGEAEAAARLAHPNIVHLYDVGRTEQGPYLILELLRGRTLAEELCEGPLPLREVVRVAVEISRGLAHAHQQGVVHRDLKPSNVFLCDDGQVKVLDFGLAHVFGRGGVAGGTPAYMAPEQAQGETGDERSDVFSLGVVVREMLTGRVPVPSPSPPPDATEASPLSPAAAGERGQPTAISVGVRGQIAPTPSGVPALTGAPAVLAKLVTRMLELDPAKRPADGAEAHQHLAAIQKSLEPKRLLWAALSVATAALVGAGTFAYFWQRPLPPGRVLTALADTDNQTGDPDLDGVSELLRTALEQSKRVSIMARSRLVTALREPGGAIPRSIGEDLAQDAARRLQAQVLVVPAVRTAPGGYDVAIRAVDPARRQTFLSARETAGAKATIPAALDRLAARVRKALDEETAQAPKVVVAVADLAPANPEALRHYAEGTRLRSEGRTEEAVAAFQSAVAADPDFLLPRLAILEDADWGRSDARYMGDVKREEQLAAIRKNLHRLPAKERAYADSLLAQDAAVAANSTELLALQDRVIQESPDDARPYMKAAWLLFENRADVEAARPYIERAAALLPNDGSYPEIFDFLLAIGRVDEALDRARRRATDAPSPDNLCQLAEVHRVRGELSPALDAARQANTLRGGACLKPLLDADAIDEADALFAVGQRRPSTGWLALRGRVRESLAAYDEQAPREGSSLEQADVTFFRGFYLLAREDAEAVWRGTEALFRIGDKGRRLPCEGWKLALVGDLDRAGRVIDLGNDRHVCRQMPDAILRWKRGDRARALELFASIAVPSSELHRGEILSELGRDREAIEAFGLYRRLRGTNAWDANFDKYNNPRSLYLEAAALERLGERDEARKVLGRLLHLWDRADPDLPLLARARTLQKRLAAASGSR